MLVLFERKFLLCALLAMFVSACGGGGGGSSDNNDDNGNNNGGNQNEDPDTTLSREASDAAVGVLATYTAGEYIAFPCLLPSCVGGAGMNASRSTIEKPSIIVEHLKSLVLPKITQENNTGGPRSVVQENEVIPSNCPDGGGNMQYSYTFTQSDEAVYPFEFDISASFDNYCLEVDEEGEFLRTELNGTVELLIIRTDDDNGEYSADYDISYVYEYRANDLVVSGEGADEFTVDCVEINGEETCSELTFYTVDGSSGLYEVTDVSFIQEENGLYQYSATMTDYKDNTYTVSFDDLKLGMCENGRVGSGSGSIIINNDEMNTLEITFISCTEYTVTYQGVSNTYTY